MISRGINALWKQYNVYVYYTWLNDAGAKPGDSKCDLDRSGPQDSKYCADDGVYYLYMYRAGRSGADYPYGGAKLAADPYNINPIVSQNLRATIIPCLSIRFAHYAS